MERRIQIIYSPGTWGNTVRWMLDRFSKGSKFQGLDSPWDKDGRAHNFKPSDFNYRFIRAHQLDGREDSPDPEAFNVVMRYDRNDLVFAERCAFYRSLGQETEEKRHAQIIKDADRDFVHQTFGQTSSRCVVKELYKIQFHDIHNHAWWNSMMQYMSNEEFHQFDVTSMFNENKLIDALESISKQMDLQLEIDDNVVANVVQKVRDSYVVTTKDRVKHALDAISQNKDMPCGDFDIVEQAFIESELEKIHDCVLFPYGVNWFEKTSAINDFINTYPRYLKHMNPRLPWYNNIRNPYYLTGQIDKSK